MHKAVECCWFEMISLVAKWDVNWRDETLEKFSLRIQAQDMVAGPGQSHGVGRESKKNFKEFLTVSLPFLLYMAVHTDVPPTGVFL